MIGEPFKARLLHLAAALLPIRGVASQRNCQSCFALRLGSSALSQVGRQPTLHVPLIDRALDDALRTHRTSRHHSGRRFFGQPLWDCEPRQLPIGIHVSKRQFPFSRPYSTPLSFSSMKLKKRGNASGTGGCNQTLTERHGTGAGSNAHHLEGKRL